jgi:hypothetical protein
VRDRRLDFWRGLCLVDMVLVHLVWEGLDVGGVLAPLIGEYTRFAAGGFVFVAGMGMGLVFLPRARDAARRPTVYGDLWRRAAYVLGVHYAAAASFVALEVASGRRVVAGDGLAVVRDLILLQDAPPYGDILPLYVVLLAVAPALIELLRRGHWRLVACGSAALFTLGQWRPWLLSPRVPEEFPVVVWQAVFVAGVLFGAALPGLDACAARTRRAIAAAAALAFASVTLAAHGADLGLPVPRLVHLQKVPLNGGELVRYLAATVFVVMGTGLLWRRLEPRPVARFVESLGRRSLGVYVAHVWVQGAIIALAARLWWIGSAQAVLAPVALVLLGLLARVLDSPWPAPVRRSRLGVALRRGGALPAGAVAALLLVSAIDRRALPTDGAALVEVETLDLDAVSTNATPVPIDEPGRAEYPSGDGSDVPDGDHAVSADVPISL